MNAPLNTQPCQANPSYCKFGAETLLKLLAGFEENINGIIKNEDVECVHKTRVASRRLRATLPLFQPCFPPKPFKKWTKEIKKVTRLLAGARDLDVQIAFIEKYMQNLPPTEKKSVGLLLKDHKNQRKNVQTSVEENLEKLKASEVLGDIEAFCRQNVAAGADVVFDANVLEKAYWHISFRLDDFLGMEKYVYLENEKQNHHQMRIYAKKLRYTMEAFAQLYKNHLSEEIEGVKAYQDILGEMHDYDVWTEYIPQFIAATEAKNRKQKKRANQGSFERVLLGFLTYIKEKRKIQYNQFVQLWDENQKNDFFGALRKTVQAGLTITEQKTLKVLESSDAKIAVISDVHANLQALQKVLADAKERGAQVFINAGDSIGFGPCPNEVVEMLCEKNVHSVLGNFDLEVIEGKAKAKGEKGLALKFARKELSKSCEFYLSALPRELRLDVAGKKMLVTHGSPASIEEHIYHDTPTKRLKTLAADAKADVLIVGHSHEQFCREADGVFVVNPGSVGRPGDGNPQAAYAILSFNPFKAELIRLDYDVEAAAQAARKKGLPESYAQMLLQGVSLEAILERDKAGQESRLQNCKAAVWASEKTAQRHWPDVEHYKQVRKIALAFFNGLTKQHNLSNQERCWLECAATLHDIGLSKSRSSHHKKSSKLILNDTQLPFTSNDRRVIASIARYHRKGLPKPSHYNLAALDRKTLHKIKVLASLLRVADGLDYTHQSNVESVNLKVGAKRVTVECVVQAESLLEEQAFNKKKDLFEKVFAKNLVLVWKKQEKPLTA